MDFDINDLLVATERYVWSRVITAESNLGWGQFLQEDGKPTTTGSACVVASLARMGSRREPKQLSLAALSIGQGARDDGGFSKPELEDHVSLTLPTCLASRAMAAVSAPELTAKVDASVKWLREAQNSDGGWGYAPLDERSDTTSTAYALRVLSHQGDAVRTQVDDGRSWLWDARVEDGAWGIRGQSAPTLSHTSHAVEALLSTGTSSHALQPAVYWLASEVMRRDLSPWVEHYNFPDHLARELPKWLRSTRLAWTHLPAERAMLALLGLGADPTSEPVEKLRDDVIARHQAEGYWLVANLPDAAPSWAILEAVDALTLLRDTLQSAQPIIETRRELADAFRRITDLEGLVTAGQIEIDELRASVSRIAAQQKVLTMAGRAGHQFVEFVGSPAVRSRFLVVVTICLVLGYLLSWSSGATIGQKALGSAGIIGCAGTLLALDFFRRKKE